MRAAISTAAAATTADAHTTQVVEFFIPLQNQHGQADGGTGERDRNAC